LVSRTPEGYIQVTGNGNSMKDVDIGYWWYYNNLKDHLGNTRINLSIDYLSKNTHILNAGGPIDYYPFGLLITAFEGTTYANSTYLYNGKELDGMNGLNEYDYGARWQDPTIGRWPTVDPHAENRYSISPYAYCSGSPVNRIDPDGKDDKNGEKSKKNKINGVDTAAQSTTGGNEPKDNIKSTPIKQLTPLQSALKVSRSQPKGEIKASQTNAEKSYNSLSDFDKQALQSPVINSVAVGGLVTMMVVATPVVTTTVETTIKTTTLTGTNIIESSVVSTFAAGATEGIFKGVTNTPPDVNVPYLNNTPLYQTSSDFFNSITTIFMNNLPNNH